MLDEMLKRFDGLSTDERSTITETVIADTQNLLWVPSPGPQTDAYFCKADVLLYGGCVSGDTEFMTPTGWKKIEDYSAGDLVGQWDESGQLTFINPLRYIDEPCQEMIWFRNEHRVSMVLSEEHRVPLYQWDGKFVVKAAAQLEKHPSRHHVPVNYQVTAPGIDLTDTEIRLAVAIHADGSFEQKKKNSDEQYCRISFRKDRKKDRLKSFLVELGIEWHEYHNPNRPTEVRYGFNSKIHTKKFEEFWWDASHHQLEIILKECMFWDGKWEGDDLTFTTTSKVCADYIQYAAHACGRVATISTEKQSDPKHKDIYCVHITHADCLHGTVTFRVDAITISRVRTTRKYCFTLPSSFWLARHNGRIFITGNSGGGGKTDLGIGLAITKHSRSLLMRRKYTDLAFITDRTIEIMGTRKGFNGSAPPRFAISPKQLIEFGAAQTVGDELSWMGRPHDLLFCDEAAHFAEQQIRALMGWVRSTEPGQRVRVVFGSNPPLSDEGNWMFKMFAPWLDPAYPEPAKSGELRYCIVGDDDMDVWVDGPGQYSIDGIFVTDNMDVNIDGVVAAMSRTFIPAKLADNPFQNTKEYRAQQDGLPKHLRDAIRDGNFLSVRKDHDLQLIPTDWIQQSMDRWTPKPPDNVPMCAIAADLTGMGSETGGGKQDKFVLASRHDGYYNELVVTEADDAKMGKDKAAKIQRHRRDGAMIILDMGGGYGDSTYEHLDNNGIRAVKYKGAAKSAARTKASKIPFFNKRAEAYYRFMEDLDPGQPGGSRITLPNDPFLMADLCSVRFDKNNSDLNIIKLESKKDLCARLGRSTDYGDPVVMAWTNGGKIASHYHQWKKTPNGPKVRMSKRSNSRRR